MSPWISAFRPRTLPLALASILTGAFLAAAAGRFNGRVVALAALTTVLLQVLSNLANDYGDSQNGADSIHRQGPARAVQSGAISPAQMKRGMVVCGLLALGSGLLLLWVALGAAGLGLFLAFLALGLAAIWAAVNYTAGANPYGYAGLGDLSVFLFFGLVGVCGTYFLQAGELPLRVLLPATALGCFATAVLNVNNIRDLKSDGLAGKITVPVRLGPVRARRYHGLLLLLGLGCATVFVALTYHSPWQWLFVLATPLFGFNARQVWQRQESMQLDPLLKQMALSTLVFTVLFGLGQVLGEGKPAACPLPSTPAAGRTAVSGGLLRSSTPLPTVAPSRALGPGTGNSNRQSPSSRWHLRNHISTELGVAG